jgi:hypothetical protein
MQSMGLRLFPVARVDPALFTSVPETNERVKCRSQAPEEAREQYLLLCQQLFHTMALLETISPARKDELENIIYIWWQCYLPLWNIPFQLH